MEEDQKKAECRFQLLEWHFHEPTTSIRTLPLVTRLLMLGPIANPIPEPGPTTKQRQSEHRRSARLELYQRVRQLHEAGQSNRSIAAQLALGRNLVRRFVVAGEFPERGARQPLRSILDPFVPYLEEQLAAGRDNGLQLWREIRDQQGYKGSRALASRWVARHRHLVPPPDPVQPKPQRRGHPPTPATCAPRPAERRCSARQAAFLLMRQPEELNEEDGQLVERLCQLSQEIETAQRLTHEFMGMVRRREGARLEGWLGRVEGSAIPEMVNFAAGIRRDKAAVVAGLTLEYSSGQVEGQVNRLKLVKRSMYGRGKLDLLRLRVLAA